MLAASATFLALEILNCVDQAQQGGEGDHESVEGGAARARMTPPVSVKTAVKARARAPCKAWREMRTGESLRECTCIKSLGERDTQEQQE